MNRPERLQEAEIARIICDFFTSKGFRCKKDGAIFSRGLTREYDIADVACTKDRDVRFIEIKTASTISRRMVQDLVANTQIPSLADKKIYLAVQSTTRFQRGSRKLIEYSRLGLIIVQGLGHVDIVKDSFMLSEFKIVDKILEDSLKGISKIEITAPSVRLRPFTIGQYLKSRMEPITVAKPPPLKIPEELLDYIDKLRHISYAKNLRYFKEQYEKASPGKDEDDVIMHALEDLWSGKYEKPQSYKSFESFNKFEPILKQIPSYRDHLIHSFQVFLTGAAILDTFHEDFESVYRNKLANAEKDSLDLSWLLCSTFHDFCYPIQMYDKVNDNIFKEFLDLDFSPVELQIEKIMLEKNQLKYIDQIVSLYTHLTSGSKTEWIFDSDCKIDDELRSLILRELGKKNHATLGALTLLRKIRMEKFAQENEIGYLTGRFSTDIYPAALAILLHDPEFLCQVQSAISFETNPLAFLLIYCDTVQEHGRLETEGDAKLKSFGFLNKTVETSLRFYNQQNYEKKVAETQRVFDKIQSHEVCFKLEMAYKGKGYSQNTCEQEK